MENVKYVGIDPSSTNTGVVALNSDGALDVFHLISPDKSLDFDDRVVFILLTLKGILKNCIADRLFVSIEAPSFMSKGKTSQLSMLCGAIYYNLLMNDSVDVVLVQPSKLKKFFTGNGKASKEDIIEHVPQEIVRLFRSKHKKIDDLTDAYALAKFSLKHFSKGT